MKLIILTVTMFVSFTFAQNIVKSKIVFDYNGQRQMAIVGTKSSEKDGQRVVVVSWHEEVKNGSKSSRTQKVDLNSPTVFFEVPSQKLNLNGKSVDVKTGDKILGKDKNVYEVAGVFSNGEIALRLVEQKYGKLRTQYNTMIKGSEFIASVEVPCIGYICKEALVRKENASQLCGVQKVDYYKKNKLQQSKIPTQSCNRFEKGTEGEAVLILFQNDTVVTSYQPARALYPDLPAEDVPVAIEQ